MEHKRCTKCGKTKSIDEFYKKRGDCKLCCNAISRKRYAKNPEKKLAKAKIWRKNNKEEISEWHKLYYIENKKNLNKMNNQYYADNVEKMKSTRRKYYTNNRDRMLLRQKEYQKENLGKIAAATAKYRAAKDNRTPGWANLEEINMIYENCPTGFHVDHIIPLRGKIVSGLHVPENLQFLTASENTSKGNSYSSEVTTNARLK